MDSASVLATPFTNSWGITALLVLQGPVGPGRWSIGGRSEKQFEASKEAVMFSKKIMEKSSKALHICFSIARLV